MVRYLILFSYIGTKFKGLQNLPQFPGQTIQGVLEDALRTLCPLNNPVTTSCSRTDSGVHAMKNAVHVDLEHPDLKETFQPHRITDRLNLYFKKNHHDIVFLHSSFWTVVTDHPAGDPQVNKTCLVPNTFHARHASLRSYIYRIALLKPHLKEFSFNEHFYDEYLPIAEKDRCYIIHGSLNPSTVQEAVKLFIGTHDFSTFAKRLHKDGKDPLKTVSECRFDPCTANQNFFHDPKYENIQMWEFYIQADSFLYHQVRKMVGTLLSVGYDFLTLSDVQKMLDKPNQRAWVKSVLPPPCGLFLANISYHNVTAV